MTKRKERRLKWALSVGVVVLALLLAFYFVVTKEEPPRAEKPLEGTLVEVIQLEASRHEVELHAKGTVVPANEVVLQPELGGRVIWQSAELVPGGRFKTGDPILRIDARDYELAAESYPSQVNRAKLELKAAQSSLKKAQLDLSRTTLRAPFNAMVVTESVDLGQLISPQTPVARIVGTDEYHVQVSVPVESLRTIRVATEEQPGSAARIVQHVGQETIERHGEVIRQLPDLDPGGAMARILVSIEDPLGKGSDLPLLLGSFVHVEIAADPIADAIRVPRVALRSGRHVYVMNEKNLLEIRDVQIAWAEPDAVLITAGIRPRERIVTSRIPTPVPNMLLRAAEPEPPPAAAELSPPAAQATP
jgi:multidrug efflux pump subunit AcrA (membrane-fusion protein)